MLDASVVLMFSYLVMGQPWASSPVTEEVTPEQCSLMADVHQQNWYWHIARTPNKYITVEGVGQVGPLNVRVECVEVSKYQ